MSKILIVEDDPGVSRALTIRLKSAGFDVVSAGDALAGMRVAVQEIPDLAILDISMPAGNGLRLADRFQNVPATAGMPFIILTASKEPSLRERAESLGAASFIEKPFESEELLAAVHDALAVAKR